MRIPYAYLKQQTWLYRRNYPRALQPMLGQALKQSLKTGDAKVANTETIRHKMLELGWSKVSVKWGGVDYARVVWLRPGCSAQRGEVVAPDGARQPIREESHVEIDI